MTFAYARTAIALLAIKLISITFPVNAEEAEQNPHNNQSPTQASADYTELCDEMNELFYLPQDNPARFALNNVGSREMWRDFSILKGEWSSTEAERKDALEEITALKKEIELGLKWPHKIPPTFAIPYAEATPTIDGKIGPKEWCNALAFSGSYQISETEKKEDGAVWKVMWDERYLYFAADFPDRNIMKSEDKKLPYLGDSLEVFIMSSKRMKIYWEVIVGCGKDVFDGFHCNDKFGGWAPNPEIDMKNLQYEISIRKNGYSVELGIPFNEIPNYMLGNNPENGDSLYFAIVRTNKEKPDEYPGYTSAYPLLYGGHNIFGHAKMILRK